MKYFYQDLDHMTEVEPDKVTYWDSHTQLFVTKEDADKLVLRITQLEGQVTELEDELIIGKDA